MDEGIATNANGAALTRRAVMATGAMLAGAFALPGTASAGLFDAAPPSPRVVRPDLLRRALSALDRHAGSIEHRDRIAIADFSAPSSQVRFHFVDLVSGHNTALLVAHGSGSDPAHTGYVSRFSNDYNSNASCEGAFVASDYYVGKHGRSQRLVGLDPTNSNALGRAIVMHSAWYANPEMIPTHGMLGRSQGCFAVPERELERAFALLGPGRMIFAAKV